jgi:optic atrophy 3 protein
VRKDILKEEMIIQEKLELQSTLNELIFQVERQDTIIREMSRTVAEVEARPWTKILQKVGTTIYSDKKNTNSTTNNVNYNPERNLLFKALNTIENDKNKIISEKESSRNP